MKKQASYCYCNDISAISDAVVIFTDSLQFVGLQIFASDKNICGLNSNCKKKHATALKYFLYVSCNTKNSNEKFFYSKKYCLVTLVLTFSSKLSTTLFSLLFHVSYYSLSTVVVLTSSSSTSSGAALSDSTASTQCDSPAKKADTNTAGTVISSLVNDSRLSGLNPYSNTMITVFSLPRQHGTLWGK